MLDGWEYIYDYSDSRFLKRNDSLIRPRSIIVIPSKVIKYGVDDSWIIVESMEPECEWKKNCKSAFWIIDKDYDYSSDAETCKQELDSLTIGPLDSVAFRKELAKRDIKIKMKVSTPCFGYGYDD